MRLLSRGVSLVEVDLSESRFDNASVNPEIVRMSIDLPRALHQKLREAATRKGCSTRQLILGCIERFVEELEPRRPRRRLKLEPPIVPSVGKPFDLTNEQIYELIGLP